LGFGIRKKPIPDPGVKKAPDPESGSATLINGRQKCGKEQRERSSSGTFRGNSRDTKSINYYCEHFVKKIKKILQNGSFFIRKGFLYSDIAIGIPEAELC
jgi:hypothetical protein